MRYKFMYYHIHIPHYSWGLCIWEKSMLSNVSTCIMSPWAHEWLVWTKCAEWIRLGGPPSGRSARGKFLPGWKRSLTGRQPFSPETGETVDRVTGRPFPGRYWSSHDLRSPHTGYRLGNVTWKMVLKCRWVGGDDETGEEDASLDVEQQQRWLMNHSWLCACALEAASACRISYMSKSEISESQISTCRNRHAGDSSRGACLVSPRISSEPENFNQIWCWSVSTKTDYNSLGECMRYGFMY